MRGPALARKVELAGVCEARCALDACWRSLAIAPARPAVPDRRAGVDGLRLSAKDAALLAMVVRGRGIRRLRRRRGSAARACARHALGPRDVREPCPGRVPRQLPGPQPGQPCPAGRGRAAPRRFALRARRRVRQLPPPLFQRGRQLLRQGGERKIFSLTDASGRKAESRSSDEQDCPICAQCGCRPGLRDGREHAGERAVLRDDLQRHPVHRRRRLHRSGQRRRLDTRRRRGAISFSVAAFGYNFLVNTVAEQARSSAVPPTAGRPDASPRRQAMRRRQPCS